MTDGQITNRDLYEVVRDTERQLGALALQVATLVAEWRGVGDRLDSGSSKMNDLETRMRSMEKFRWMLVGALVLVSGAAAWVGYLTGRH